MTRQDNCHHVVGSKTLVPSAGRRSLHVMLICFGVAFLTPSSAFVPTKAVVTAVAAFTKHVKALPDDEIVRLARVARQTKGTRSVGLILGKQRLPPEVLEDTYLRIAVAQDRLPRREAEGMFQRLRGTDGFRTTLRKVIGNSPSKTSGHLNELRIADQASQHGFEVKGIGVRFNDGRKAADTDIDIVLERRGTIIAIEAKDYTSSTPIPIDSFRADMDSLKAYAAAQSDRQVISVFSVTNKPADPFAWQSLQSAAAQRGVQLIDGAPEVQIELIKMF